VPEDGTAPPPTDLPPSFAGANEQEESMPPSLDVTGRWSGNYVQRDQSRQIVAALTQAGEDLTGSMHDQQTEFEQSVFEMAVEGGLPPGADEQIVSQLRKQFPDDPNAPIRVAMTLPPDSVLEGTVRGRTIYFLKIYQGEAFSGYRIGERRVGMTVASHGVHYRGQVSPDGQVIEGTWWIDPDPRRGTRRSEGTFRLQRE
jgi:hypothetical protein